MSPRTERRGRRAARCPSRRNTPVSPIAGRRGSSRSGVAVAPSISTPNRSSPSWPDSGSGPPAPAARTPGSARMRSSARVEERRAGASRVARGRQRRRPPAACDRRWKPAGTRVSRSKLRSSSAPPATSTVATATCTTRWPGARGCRRRSLRAPARRRGAVAQARRPPRGQQAGQRAPHASDVAAATSSTRVSSVTRSSSGRSQPAAAAGSAATTPPGRGRRRRPSAPAATLRRSAGASGGRRSRRRAARTASSRERVDAAREHQARHVRARDQQDRRRPPRAGRAAASARRRRALSRSDATVTPHPRFVSG